MAEGRKEKEKKKRKGKREEMKEKRTSVENKLGQFLI